MTVAQQFRMYTANKAIVIIASHGRQFFSSHAEGRNDHEPKRISHFEFRNNRLWFIDKYTQKAIYIAYRRGAWRGFSEGGTLRDLVCEMADWINGKHEQFPVNRLGPWPKWVCDGDLWGYGGSMAKVREEISALLAEAVQP